jgi:hypothetical protein
MKFRKDWFCKIGDTLLEPDFAVIGDSHSASLALTFDSVAKINKISGIFSSISSCPPLIGVTPIRSDSIGYNCVWMNNNIYNHIKEKKFKKIFLISRWTYFLNGGLDGTRMYIGESIFSKKNNDVTKEFFIKGLENTIKLYNELGVEVYIIQQLPNQKINPQTFYKVFNNDLSINKYIDRYSISLNEHIKFQKDVYSTFSQIKGKFKLIDFTNVYCKNNKCLFGTNNESFYFDDDHISNIGAFKIINELKDILK